MTDLIDALVLYADEHLISRFQQETAVQTRIAWRKVTQLTDQIKRSARRRRSTWNS